MDNQKSLVQLIYVAKSERLPNSLSHLTIKLVSGSKLVSKVWNELKASTKWPLIVKWSGLWRIAKRQRWERKLNNWLIELWTLGVREMGTMSIVSVYLMNLQIETFRKFFGEVVIHC